MSYRIIDLSDVPKNHPVSLFSDFWFENKSSDFVPLRAKIDPMKIPAILPWILLLELVDVEGVKKYRYRLTGTGCRTIFNMDYTGKFLGDGLTPEGAEARLREFQDVGRLGQPIYSASHLPIAEREFIKVYRGVFPVSLSGTQVDQIFVIIAQEDMVLHLPKPHSSPALAQSGLNIV